MNTDNREQFADQLKALFENQMKTLQESLSKDRVMLTMDAIAGEAIRLNIESWDQLPLAELRAQLQIARLKEKQSIGLFQSEQK